MKKIKVLLVLFLSFIPVIAKADMGSPIMRPYKMVVIDPNGISYYDWDGNEKGKLLADEIFTVEYEYDGDYSIRLKNDEYVYLKNLNGAKSLEEEVNPENLKDDEYIQKYSIYRKALVYAENGVDMYKGPANGYEKVGHIDKGTNLSFKYYISDSGITYIYVEHNGVKGWVGILDASVLLQQIVYDYKTEKLTLLDFVEYMTAYDVITSCGTIPRNTMVKSKYKSDDWSGNLLIEYNGCETLINYDSVIYIDETEIAVAKSNIKLYEYLKEDNYNITVINKIADITKGDNFKILGNLYLGATDEAILYVEYKGQKGWVDITWENYDYIDEAVEQPIEEPTEEPEITEPTEEKEDTKEETKTEEKKEENNKTNPVDFVTICVIVGVSVALSSLVTIILMNKKNKSKKNVTNENSDVENKNDEVAAITGSPNNVENTMSAVDASNANATNTENNNENINNN